MSYYQSEKYRNQDFYLANPYQRIRLHIAKEALAALAPAHQPPTAESYAKALEFLDEHGADYKEDGKTSKRRAHLSIIADREAAIAYAAEKKRLADALNAIRQEIHDEFIERNPPPTDLE